MTAVNINRTSSGVVLPTAFSADIWQAVKEQSVALGLTAGIDLPGPGLTIDMVTGDPTPGWVSESEETPVSRGSVSTDLMTPYTLGLIVPFSNKFRRDKNALYNALANRLPTVLAKKIDDTVFRGTSPGTNFDVLSGATIADLNAVATPAGALTTQWDDIDRGLVVAQNTIATATAATGGDPSHIVYSPRMRTMVQSAQDGNKRPKFAIDPRSNGGMPADLLGMATVKSLNLFKADASSTTHDEVGLMGDFSYAMHGIVQQMTMSLSDQATIQDGATSVNLWQRRMFALLIDVELGFVVRDAAAFLRLTELTL